ncbi:MAG TPA: hypothetical protein VE967_12635, partial [Gemmatimonadaceae bacterium]|nr:hypothetical protein [Gemmatimonadaceae bacterium]
MSARRRGIALLIALAALVILAALAALAHASAVDATHASVQVRGNAQAANDRTMLRARLHALLAHHARIELDGHTFALWTPDTTAAVSLISGSWYRAAISANGTPVVSEVARAWAPVAPPCAAIMTGVVRPASPGVADKGSCADSVVLAPATIITAYDSALAANVVPTAFGDSVEIRTDQGVTGIWRATRVAVIPTGYSARGLVIAPLVITGSLSSVRGMVIARDSVVTGAGASVTADPSLVLSVLAER